MKRLAFLAAALCVAQAVTSASAAQSDLQSARLQAVLRALAAPAPVAEPGVVRATVTRNATFRIKGTVQKLSTTTTAPLRIQVMIDHTTANLVPYFSEFADRPLVFTGAATTANFDISIPVRWTGADTAMPVNITIIIDNDDCVCAENENGRSLIHSLPSFPLPAEGATVVRTYSLVY